MATPMGARSASARRERSRLSGGNGALEPIGRRFVVQDLSSLLCSPAVVSARGIDAVDMTTWHCCKSACKTRPSLSMPTQLNMQTEFHTPSAPKGRADL